MLLDNLKPNPKNPRVLTKSQFDQLKKKIKSFPQMLEKRPIVYDGAIVLGGNQRLEVLKELAKDGFEIKDSYFADASGWSDEQKRQFVITDNISDGEWDYDVLANEWDDLPLEEWGMGTTKWEKEVEEDEPPEIVEGEPDSKLGEVYQLGRHRLMCGDSTKIGDVEKLRGGKKADMVFTDPPYNVGLKYNEYLDQKEAKEYIEFNKRWFDLVSYVDKKIIFVGNVNTQMWINNFKPLFIGIWDKGEGATTHGYITNYTAWEPIFFYGGYKRKRHTDVFRYVGGEGKIEHPCPKPVKLLSDLVVNFTEKDDIILDLFGGSGSTLIAAEQTDRVCYMMELDPKYCDVIRKRYDNFVKGV